MLEFIYLIHPFREGFFEHPTAIEVQVMDDHYRYLREAVDAGAVLLAGPCLDDTFGIVILQAENEAAARTFMLNDPALVQNVMMAELHPLKVSLRAP